MNIAGATCLDYLITHASRFYFGVPPIREEFGKVRFVTQVNHACHNVKLVTILMCRWLLRDGLLRYHSIKNLIKCVSPLKCTKLVKDGL